MLSALSLLVATPPADEPPPIPQARTEFVDALHWLLAAIDVDGDGRVSHAEWIASGRRRFSAADRASPLRMSLSAPPEQVFRELDDDNDGAVSFEEFAREQLAHFDCVDSDRDGIVLQAEAEAGRSRCARC